MGVTHCGAGLASRQLQVMRNDRFWDVPRITTEWEESSTSIQNDPHTPTTSPICLQMQRSRKTQDLIGSTSMNDPTAAAPSQSRSTTTSSTFPAALRLLQHMRHWSSGRHGSTWQSLRCISFETFLFSTIRERGNACGRGTASKVVP